MPQHNEAAVDCKRESVLLYLFFCPHMCECFFWVLGHFIFLLLEHRGVVGKRFVVLALSVSHFFFLFSWAPYAAVFFFFFSYQKDGRDELRR